LESIAPKWSRDVTFCFDNAVATQAAPMLVLLAIEGRRHQYLPTLLPPGSVLESHDHLGATLRCAHLSICLGRGPKQPRVEVHSINSGLSHPENRGRRVIQQTNCAKDWQRIQREGSAAISGPSYRRSVAS
jgi:hypothetical protein